MIGLISQAPTRTPNQPRDAAANQHALREAASVVATARRRANRITASGRHPNATRLATRWI